MPVTPVEILHLQLPRGFLGYRRAVVQRTLEEIAASYEAVWRQRADLADRVESLEEEVRRHQEMEQLLRQTLVSAEKAAADLREQARKEAEVVVAEAHAEARKVVHRAATEHERLAADARRIEAMLRSALATLAADPAEGSSTPGQRLVPAVDEHTDPGIRKVAG